MKLKIQAITLCLVLAIATVLITKFTASGLFQCLPYCLLYLVMIYNFDRWVSRLATAVAFTSLVYMTYTVFSIFLLTITTATNLTAFDLVNILCANVLMSTVVSATQIPFILKAIKNK